MVSLLKFRLSLGGVVLCGLLLTQVVAAGTLAQFRTSLGDIEVELFDQQKPATVANFIRYVEAGRYQDSFVHRLEPGYVMQGGGYVITNRYTATNWYTVPVESFGTVSNEFAIGPLLSNTNGTLAMAKVLGDPDSATSQWFINLGDNSAKLDTNNGGYTVFGRVVGGTNVFEQFRRFQYFAGQSSNLVLLGYYAAPFNQLPLARPMIAATNFIYCDITLLNVQVAAVVGGREISWRSVAEVTNRVEFTVGFSPPAWQTLITTNGSGAAMKFTDSNPAAPARFYRVRVDY